MATDRAIAKVRKKATRLQAFPLTCRGSFICGLSRHPRTIQIIQSKQWLDRVVAAAYLLRIGMATGRDRDHFPERSGIQPMEAKARPTMALSPGIDAAAAELHRAIIVAFPNVACAPALADGGVEPGRA